ncbi:MAG: HTTM domain-containing protein [Planctomycetota bacterium]
MPASRLGAFRAVVCLVALYDVLLWSHAVLNDASAVSDGTQDRPWTPIFLFQLLGLDPIQREAAELVQVAAVGSLLLGAFGVCARLSCLVAAVLFYYWSGLAYSFGKPHHDKVALAITLASLPFARVGAAMSVDAWVRRRLRRRRRPKAREPERAVRGMPIRVAQYTLAIGYCGAGLAKVWVGGLDWFNGYTLQGIMLGHDGYLSRLVGASPSLCQIQSIGVVSVQVLFPLVLIWPKSRWFFLPAAMSFHLMTWMTMDTGPYMRVWLMLWAFVPLEKVPSALLQALRRGWPSAVATTLGCGALGALIGYVAHQAIAAVWLWSFAGLLLLAFVGYALRRPKNGRSWNAGARADTTPAQ